MFIANKIKQLIYKFTYMFFFVKIMIMGKEKVVFFLFVKVKTEGNNIFISVNIFFLKYIIHVNSSDVVKYYRLEIIVFFLMHLLCGEFENVLIFCVEIKCMFCCDDMR